MDLSDLSQRNRLLPVVTGQPQAVIALHPLGLDRRVELALLNPDETLAEYFDRIGLDLTGRTVRVTLNGARIPREMWRHTRPRTGQLIEVHAVVEGDGAPQKIIGALLVVIGTFVPGAQFLIPYGFKLMALGFLTSLAGWLMPRKELSGRRDDAVSPTYALQGVQNQARLYQPLPVLMGTHKMVPDYAARPYAEFEGDDQFLYAAFHFGFDTAGFNVTDLKLGDTPLASYEGVQTEWSGPDGKLTLVAGNVDSLTGGSLTFAAGWIVRTSSVNARALAIDIEGSLFYQGSNGLEPRSATVEAEYRLLPAGAWQPFFTTGVAIATQYWSRGYFQAGQWQQVSFDTNLDAGAHTEGEAAGDLPLGGDAGGVQPLVWSRRTYTEAQARGWNTPWPLYPTSNATFFEFVNGTSKPVRRSFKRDVAAGQYEVRVRRGNPDETDARAVSQLVWSTLRTYQDDTASYTGQKRLALKIKASGQLTGTVDTLNGIGSRRVWVWTGSAWQLQQSSNPAWWFLWVATGLYVDGRLVFGLGLQPAQIDYDAIRAWALYCDSNLLTFNGVTDREISNGELLDLICATGYASKTYATGKLGVIWDAVNQPISGVVSMPTIRAGSLRVTYDTQPAAEEIVGVFLNAANGYAQEEVRKLLPGVTNPRRSERVELFGVTDQAAAGRYVNLRAASLIYRRKYIDWEQDAEGAIHRRGDVVAFSHDMTQWGYSGRLVSLSGAAVGSTLVLDRRVPANLVNVNNEWIGVRVPGEAGYRVLRVQCVPAGAGNDNDTLTLVDAWPVGVPLPGATRPAMDYTWLYDFTFTPGYRVKIIDFVPRTRSDGSIGVQLRGVPDVPEFYAAANGTFTPVAPATLLNSAAVISGLVITEELKPQGNTWIVELTATWNANDQYASAEVVGVLNGGAPIALGRTENGRRRLSWVATVDEQWVVTVRPLNALGQPGVPLTAPAYTVQGLRLPPSIVTGFTTELTTNGILLKWDEAPDLDYQATELRIGASWEASLVITRKSARTHLWGWQPAGASTVWAKHIDTTGNESTSAAAAVVTVNAPATPSLQPTVIANNVLLSWSDARTTQPIKQYRFRVGSDFNSATELGSSGGDSRFETYFFSTPGAKRIWIQAEDLAGNLGTPNSVDVTVTNALGFKLRADFNSTFTGTRTNAAPQPDGSLLLPVDTAETWSTHFSTRGWATIGAQVAAGFPLYAQPNPASGTYQEVFDLGATFTAATTVTVSFGVQWLQGNGTASVQIAVSNASSTGPWTDLPAGSNVTTDVDFRWVRVTLTVTGDGGTNDLARLTGLACRVSQQKLTDSGVVVCNDTDVGGTVFLFNESFSGVASIQATPIGTGDRRAVVDFNYATSNPTQCRVLLFNAAGARIDGDVALYIEGFQ